MRDVVWTSPLAGLDGKPQRTLVVDRQPCVLDEIAYDDMLNLRGDARDAQFAKAVLLCSGMHLPLQPNSASIDPQRQLLWLGPDEWLLKTRDGQGQAIGAALREALQGRHSAVVEVGHGNTTLVLQGTGAAGLLARGCPLDLHARVFPTGALAQTHVAKAGVVLLCQQGGSHYELTVRRSFAQYLVEWLTAAGS